MQRLLTSMIVLCLTLPQGLSAQSRCEAFSKEECQRIVHDADVVIAKQKKLNLLLTKQNSEIKDENRSLSEAIISLRGASEGRLQRDTTVGGVGILLGIILTLVVKK